MGINVICIMLLNQSRLAFHNFALRKLILLNIEWNCERYTIKDELISKLKTQIFSLRLVIQQVFLIA